VGKAQSDHEQTPWGIDAFADAGGYGRTMAFLGLRRKKRLRICGLFVR
jgi:hypothetical protein